MREANLRSLHLCDSIHKTLLKWQDYNDGEQHISIHPELGL